MRVEVTSTWKADISVDGQVVRTLTGTFEVGIPRGGQRVIRASAPFHMPVILPIRDVGEDIHLKVRLGSPSMKATPRAHLVSKSGKTIPFVVEDDGKVTAVIPAELTKEGLLIVGASRGRLSVPGGTKFELAPDGAYWTSFHQKRQIPVGDSQVPLTVDDLSVDLRIILGEAEEVLTQVQVTPPTALMAKKL